jgi:hypothetical protein
MADEGDRASAEELAADNEGLLSSGEVRTGYISGVTFANRPVQYEVVDGMAIFEGCIALGTVEEMERGEGLVPLGEVRELVGDEEVVHAVVISGDRYRWPDALMPYTIDPALPNKQRVTDAIAHWQARTNLRFVERIAANAAQYPNYVRIFKGDGCWSRVGMRGGMQELSLADGCGFGAAVHEFGHAWGVWHEQSREDRDNFITIHWQNIEDGKAHNFNQHISDGDDIGPYDYGSIMHYGMYAFSKNGQPTITPKQAGVTIGQRSGLSDGDVAAVHHIYRTMHHNLTVSLVYATTNSKSAWVSFQNLGWRRIDTRTADGVTNTLEVLAVAKATGRKVHASLDGQNVYTAYGT